MSAVSKLELAMELCEGELSKKHAKQFVALFFEEISSSLLQGESVKLSGFGRFSVQHKQARPGRNLHTLESVEIEARRVISCTLSGKLKKALRALPHTDPRE